MSDRPTTTSSSTTPIPASGSASQEEERGGGRVVNKSSVNKRRGNYFFPPLWQARRSFCLNVLRKEGIRSVLDIGCGEGSLISILCAPPSHLDDFPPFVPPSADDEDEDEEGERNDAEEDDGNSEEAGAEEEERIQPSIDQILASSSAPKQKSPTRIMKPNKADRMKRGKEKRRRKRSKERDLQRVPKADVEDGELHLKRIVGLDIDEERLKRVAEVTRPYGDGNDEEWDSWIRKAEEEGRKATKGVSGFGPLTPERSEPSSVAKTVPGTAHTVQEGPSTARLESQLVPPPSKPGTIPSPSESTSSSAANIGDSPAAETFSDLDPLETLSQVSVTTSSSISSPNSHPTPPLSYYLSTSLDFEPRYERWSPLTVEVWKGSLEVYGDAFDDIECAIASEVIEHLSDKVLDRFGEVVMGRYRPRVVVVTTPNWEFNRFFEGKDTFERKEDSGTEGLKRGVANRKGGKRDEDEDEEDDDDDDAAPVERVNVENEGEGRYNFPDPTGRTNRVFRDSDHKFEWTREEFQTWVRRMSKEYDYDYKISGVGSLQNYLSRYNMFTTSQVDVRERIPEGVNLDELTSGSGKNFDPTGFFATQCVVFRRRYAHEPERSPRSPRSAPLAFYGHGRARSSIGKPGAGESPTTPPSASSTGTVPLPPMTAPASSPISADSTPTKPASLSLPSVPPAPPKLLVAYTHSAHPSANHPLSSRKILQFLSIIMQENIQSSRVTLRDLWSRAGVRRVCGGQIGKIVQAIIDRGGEDWDFEVLDDEAQAEGQEEGHRFRLTGEDAVTVVYKAFKARPVEEEEVSEVDERNGDDDDEWAREQGAPGIQDVDASGPLDSSEPLSADSEEVNGGGWGSTIGDGGWGGNDHRWDTASSWNGGGWGSPEERIDSGPGVPEQP